QEDWDENDDEVYDDEEDGDDDIDAQAEEMARRLNEQLWEDMRKATATESSSTPMEVNLTSTSASTLVQQPSTSHTAGHRSSRKEEAVMGTIKAIMVLLNHDFVAHNALSSTVVPNTPFNSVIDALKQMLATGQVQKATALILSQTLISLASSETLFGSLKGRKATQAKLGILGKRKREESASIPPPQHPSIYDVVSNAVHVVTHSLRTSSSINPALITSIQESLRHIFLFSVTVSARHETRVNPSNAILQEISGLIQVLAVLSGIQIGVNTTHGLSQSTDSNSMIYPCMVPSCNKMFMQLPNLRTHEHIHHPQQIQATATYDRPFPCTYPSCPASFLRNHDLKRHIKVAHERKSFECGGCGKTFSRRDAIKRHKDASVTKSQPFLFPGRPVSLCYEAAVIEVEGGGDDQDGPEDDEAFPDVKRVRTDNETGHNSTQEEEEGEITEEMISSTQAAVMQLHPLLRAVVAKASGTPLPLITSPASTQTADATPSNTQEHVSHSISHPTDTRISDESSSSQQVERNAESKSEMEMQLVIDHKSTTPPPAREGSNELSDYQTRLLEQAIADVAHAAQAQAQGEADSLEGEDGE
ncbi:hypothetical protein J3R30DRAFT_3224800, partial [Lentinula aciculospora]